MEELIQSLFKAIEAKNEHDKERSLYQGYEWNYHGHHEIQNMEDAADEFKMHLKEVVREVVQEELQSTKS